MFPACRVWCFNDHLKLNQNFILKTHSIIKYITNALLQKKTEITVSWFRQSLFVLCQFKEQKSSHDTFQTLWLIYLQRNQHFSSMSTFNRKKPRAEKQTLKNFFSFLFIKILQHVVAHHGWLCYVTLRVRLRLNNIRFLLHFHTCTDVKEQKD